MSDTQTPPSFRSDEIDDGAQDLLVGLLDLQAGMPGVQRLRAWSNEVLAVQPGERALDVGSGTGSEVQYFASIVGPSGTAVGVEPNAGMRAVAERRAAGSTARFVDGNAYNLPFADASFDVVRCERVLQHLDDPDRAVAEIARVLAPGGRVVLIDSDWETAIVHPGDPQVARKLRDVMLTRTTNPYSGRKLPGQLRTAGLVVDDIGSQALLQPPDAGTGPLVALSVAQATDSGAITRAEGDQLLADLAEGSRNGTFFMSVTMYAVLAHSARE